MTTTNDTHRANTRLGDKKYKSYKHTKKQHDKQATARASYDNTTQWSWDCGRGF